MTVTEDDGGNNTNRVSSRKCTCTTEQQWQAADGAKINNGENTITPQIPLIQDLEQIDVKEKEATLMANKEKESMEEKEKEEGEPEKTAELDEDLVMRCKWRSLWLISKA